jgi:hypothetical protein
LDGRGRLRVSEFFQGSAERTCLFAIVVKGGKFGLGGAGQYFANRRSYHAPAP